MADSIPTDPAPGDALTGVPDELARPLEDRIAETVARKAEMLARMAAPPKAR